MPHGSNVLDIRVSKAQLDRALRVFDAVIRATEALGGRWEVGSKGTELYALGGKVDVNVLESRRESRVPGSYGFMNQVLTPTGALRFRTSLYESPVDLRDTEAETLESKIPRVAKKLFLECHKNKLQRERWDEERRLRNQAEERRVAARRDLEAKVILRKRLVEAAELHHKSELIRTLCSAVARNLGGDEETSNSRKEWIEWALLEADLIDPLAHDKLPMDMTVLASELAHIKAWS